MSQCSQGRREDCQVASVCPLGVLNYLPTQFNNSLLFYCIATTSTCFVTSCACLSVPFILCTHNLGPCWAFTEFPVKFSQHPTYGIAFGIWQHAASLNNPHLYHETHPVLAPHAVAASSHSTNNILKYLSNHLFLDSLELKGFQLTALCDVSDPSHAFP